MHSQNSFGQPKADLNLSKQAQALITSIESDQTLLCDKRRYALDYVKLVHVGKTYHIVPRETADYLIDELLDYAYSRYRHDIYQGCLSPTAVYPDAILPEHTKRRKGRKTNILISRLHRALKTYSKIEEQGGWQSIPDNPKILKHGMHHDHVITLRKRLAASGDLNASLIATKRFDKKLRSAVRRFQKRHSLNPDGTVGPKTRNALNESVTQKIAKIRLNIERLRWLTGKNRTFVMVNIPAFEVSIYRNGESTLSMKVIVGRKSRPTPLISDYMTYAVLNPYWRAPKTIIKEDILPRLKRGRYEYVKDHGIVASRDLYGKETVDMESIQWKKYSEKSVPFYFLQPPGEKNYLGSIKFIFPNPLDIYIHDSPDKHLFKQDRGMYSSGCVRIQNPVKLFQSIFNPNNDNNWTEQNISAQIESKVEEVVRLKQPIKTYVLYMTVDTDANGNVHFYPDIYGYDSQMIEYIKLHGISPDFDN